MNSYMSFCSYVSGLSANLLLIRAWYFDSALYIILVLMEAALEILYVEETPIINTEKK